MRKTVIFGISILITAASVGAFQLIANKRETAIKGKLSGVFLYTCPDQVAGKSIQRDCIQPIPVWKSSLELADFQPYLHGRQGLGWLRMARLARPASQGRLLRYDHFEGGYKRSIRPGYKEVTVRMDDKSLPYGLGPGAVVSVYARRAGREGPPRVLAKGLLVVEVAGRYWHDNNPRRNPRRLTVLAPSSKVTQLTNQSRPVVIALEAWPEDYVLPVATTEADHG